MDEKDTAQNDINVDSMEEKKSKNDQNPTTTEKKDDSLEGIENENLQESLIFKEDIEKNVLTQENEKKPEDYGNQQVDDHLMNSDSRPVIPEEQISDNTESPETIFEKEELPTPQPSNEDADDQISTETTMENTEESPKRNYAGDEEERIASVSSLQDDTQTEYSVSIENENYIIQKKELDVSSDGVEMKEKASPEMPTHSAQKQSADIHHPNEKNGDEKKEKEMSNVAKEEGIIFIKIIYLITHLNRHLSIKWIYDQMLTDHC